MPNVRRKLMKRKVRHYKAENGIRPVTLKEVVTAVLEGHGLTELMQRMDMNERSLALAVQRYFATRKLTGDTPTDPLGFYDLK